MIIIGQKRDQLERLAPELKIPCELKWLPIDHWTSGQLATAGLALPLIPTQNSMAIFNADSFFQSKTLISFMHDQSWEGIIPCSTEPGDSWSFCKVRDPENSGPQKIIEVAEKNRISPWCSIGFYFFRHLSLFKKMSEIELSEKKEGEFFVSTLYNRYLAENYPVLMLPTDEFKAMGTLEQIQQYWNLSLEQIKTQNLSSTKPNS